MLAPALSSYVDSVLIPLLGPYLARQQGTEAHLYFRKLAHRCYFQPSESQRRQKSAASLSVPRQRGCTGRLAGLVAFYPLLGTRAAPDTRGPSFRESGRELGGGCVGQAIQIMFKALLLPFRGEL